MRGSRGGTAPRRPNRTFHPIDACSGPTIALSTALAQKSSEPLVSHSPARQPHHLNQIWFPAADLKDARRRHACPIAAMDVQPVAVQCQPPGRVHTCPPVAYLETPTHRPLLRAAAPPADPASHPGYAVTLALSAQGRAVSPSNDNRSTNRHARGGASHRTSDSGPRRTPSRPRSKLPAGRGRQSDGSPGSGTQDSPGRAPACAAPVVTRPYSACRGRPRAAAERVARRARSPLSAPGSSRLPHVAAHLRARLRTHHANLRRTTSCGGVFQRALDGLHARTP